MKTSLVLIIALLLVTITAMFQDALAAENKDTKLRPGKTTHDGLRNTFGSADGWFFSLSLPDNWETITNLPFAFANTKIDGNHIVVDNIKIKQGFSSRDDFHSYLKNTEMNTAGFSLGNSMTTTSTSYGYKTTIELKLTKQDGNQILVRKDFHFVNQQDSMYLVHGFSSDFDSFKTLRYAMSTFKPLV